MKEVAKCQRRIFFPSFFHKTLKTLIWIHFDSGVFCVPKFDIVQQRMTPLGVIFEGMNLNNKGLRKGFILLSQTKTGKERWKYAKSIFWMIAMAGAEGN